MIVLFDSLEVIFLTEYTHQQFVVMSPSPLLSCSTEEYFRMNERSNISLRTLTENNVLLSWKKKEKKTPTAELLKMLLLVQIYCV